MIIYLHKLKMKNWSYEIQMISTLNWYLPWTLNEQLLLHLHSLSHIQWYYKCFPPLKFRFWLPLPWLFLAPLSLAPWRHSLDQWPSASLDVHNTVIDKTIFLKPVYLNFFAGMMTFHVVSQKEYMFSWIMIAHFSF